VWTADSPRVLFDLLEGFDRMGLAEVLEGYLGERPAISVKKSTLRRVPLSINDKPADWHQDGAFLGEGIRTCNVWLALTRCGAGTDASGLDVVPKRYAATLETGTEGAWFDWSVGPGVVERETAQTGVLCPTFEAGDALLFDELFLHRTHTDAGLTRERYAIESWFFAPSTYPSDQIPLVI
jgi:hypothetical protein